MIDMAFVRLALGSIGGAAGRAARRVKARAAPTARESFAPLDPSSQAIEAVYQATAGEGARVVAVIGVEADSGATCVARALARRCVLAGARTLLIDMGGLSLAQGVAEPEGGLRKESFDTVVLRPTGDDVYEYRSAERLRAVFDESYGAYQSIVVDCAPVIEREGDAVPGRLSARGVDAVLMVCLGGRVTRETVERAKELVAGASLRGVIVNGRDQPTVGAEIAREAMRLSRLLPGLAKSVARRALKSKFLNVHA